MDLLAKKEQLLREIQYYEGRIAEARAKCNRELPVDDDSDSDSDSDLPPHLNMTPSLEELKRQEEDLKNCINATQELCDVVILEHETKVLVHAPVFQNEPEVTEPGTWRHVNAECNVDNLVSCFINFYVHQPDRKFLPASYRGLRVKIVKTKYALELEKSVLSELKRPSDAVEVIRSYASAFRSRRDSLARLHDQFGNDIVIDSKPDGGFLICCPNLLDVSWTLQNKFSPIAPFHHRMKFDVEYMDQEYIKSITQAHRQLSEPDVDTQERTRLLAQIITTCLNARGATMELHESLSSDPEGPSHLEKLRTTLDKEPEAPEPQRKSNSNLMAPPKTVPKRTKPKQKEGSAVKRTAQDGGDQNGAKKAKVGEDTEKPSDDPQEIAKIVQTIEKRHESSKTTENPTKNVNEKSENTDVATVKTSIKEVGDKKKSVASAKTSDASKKKAVQGKVAKAVSKPSNTEKPSSSGYNVKKVAQPTKNIVDATKKAVDPAKKVATTKTPPNNVENTTFKTAISSVGSSKMLPVNQSTPINDDTRNKTQPNPKKSGPIPTKKPISDANRAKSGIVKPKHTAVSKHLPLQTVNNPKTGNTKVAVAKISKAKENKGTKIPLPEAVLKKIPLRISPRKGLSKSGTSGVTTGTKIVKPVSTTNIPRFVKPKPT